MSINEVQRFLTILDEEVDEFSFQTLDNNKVNKAASKSEFRHGSIEDHYKWLDTMNQVDNRGIYVCVNATDLKGTEKSNIKYIRAFFADVDGTVENRATFKEHLIEPTMIISTGRGEHCYFVLKEFIEATPDNVKRFENLQRRIIAYYGSDSTIKNVNRIMRLPGFIHQKSDQNGVSDPFLVAIKEASQEYYTIEQLEAEFPEIKAGRKVKTQDQLLTEANVGKGILFPDVQEWLKKPWVDTKGDNAIVFKCICNIKKNGYSKEECITMLEEKGEKLHANVHVQISAVYKDEKIQVEPYYNKKMLDIKEFIWSSKIYRDVNSKGEVWVVNEDTRAKESMKEDAVRAALGPKMFAAKLKLCYTTYNPATDKLIFSGQNGYTTLNTYKKPDWFSKLDPDIKKMPDAYDAIFKHIFPDTASREYCLDWIAFSIRGGKNIPVLALVGTVRGIGKNVIGSIISSLHGSDNSIVSGQALLSKEFNSQVYGKTFIHMDEVSIDHDSHLESIKAYTNNRINIEGKGIDAETKTFFGNIYLTNNRLDSLKGVKAVDDRQFSIPMVTGEKLNIPKFKKFMPGEISINWLWENDALISQLASYLYNRDLSGYDYVTNFKSDHYFEVIKNSDPEWYSFVLEDFACKHFNCAVRLSAVKTETKKVEGITIGKTALDKLISAYPSRVAKKKVGPITHILFAKEDEDQKEFELRVKKCNINDLQGFELIEEGKIRYINGSILSKDKK